MKFTDAFVKQHDELVDTIGKISKNLEVQKLLNNLDEVQYHLSILSRTLNAHLLMEDRGLYPVMLEHGNLTAKELARLYIDEMGGLKSDFVEYSINWQENRIIDNPEKFIEDTKSIFYSLANRVEKENTILYPFVEKLFFKNKDGAELYSTDEELAAKIEIDRMRALKYNSEIDKKINFYILQAEYEIAKQQKKWFFRNYEIAIQNYRKAYLLGYHTAHEIISELKRRG